jgi:hypothetical protein
MTVQQNGRDLERRYRLTEVALLGDHVGYPAFLRREPSAVRWLRYLVRRRDRWLVDPLMPKSSVDVLVADVNRGAKGGDDESLRAHWDGDEFVLVDPAMWSTRPIRGLESFVCGRTALAST